MSSAKPYQEPPAELYKLMAHRVTDYAIFLLDTEGHVQSWNPGAQRVKLYRAEEIIGRHFSVFYTPEDIARRWPQEELQRALMEGRFEDEGWRVRKDGTRFWANVIITALRDETGKLVAFSKITRDLTERKRQEQDLRDSEERFRLLVEGVQDYAIYLLSPEGLITSWNGGARRIKGYTADEVIGRHFSRFFSADDIAAGAPWTELAVAREHGRAETEGWRVRKDGSRFWARVVVTALHDSEGRLRGFAKVTQDLTQRRHSEALEQAAQKVNDFIAVLAHELRNPLAPIRSAAQLLKETRPGDADYFRMVEAIDRQSRQLARIVDDLLDIGRITRGTFSVDTKPVSMGDVIARAAEAAQPLIADAKHQLTIDLPAAPLRLLGDELRLTQAFTNILNNAARYTNSGGRISVRVARVEERGKPFVSVSVQDNGRGIEPAFLGSIFGMFVQGKDPHGRAGSGLGVGLALARTIIEMHHGSIEAKSAGLGKGSEFTVRIPMGEAQAKPQAQAPSHAQARDAGPVEAKPRLIRRVLVVDDNADAAAMLAAQLRLQGHEVHTVYDGQSALIATEGFRPDIILLDLGMPGMSGLEVARRLRERAREPRPMIVAVTGWGKPEDEARTREAGFDRHLVKPVEDEQLRQLLNNGNGHTLH